MLTRESVLVHENDRNHNKLLQNEGWPDVLIKAANRSILLPGSCLKSRSCVFYISRICKTWLGSS